MIKFIMALGQNAPVHIDAVPDKRDVQESVPEEPKAEVDHF